MGTDWNNNQPIYLQLREKVVALILDKILQDGDTLPSVRTVSAEQRVNPITVSKAYQTLVEDELVEKKRGLGMFVKSGARALLL
ncbi:MAG: GntR family transcriptional regulator, partial [Gammaproteobacteria bacterium]|nr:GntR family transcriptional regulator [Gammaproteobacteria bacterium]